MESKILNDNFSVREWLQGKWLCSPQGTHSYMKCIFGNFGKRCRQKVSCPLDFPTYGKFHLIKNMYIIVHGLPELQLSKY